MFRDEKGVSPVIGVVLMVALTVIMAAVVASFTAGVGKITRSAPTANLAVADDPYVDINEVTDNNYYTLVKVSHKGGDILKVSELDVVVTNVTTGDTLRMSANSTDVNIVDFSARCFWIQGNTTTKHDIKPGDVVYIAVDGTQTGFGGEGFYEIKIIHKHTGQMIVDAQVYCY